MMRLVCLLLFVVGPAYAVECPAGMSTCKVLYLSDQEVQILVQERGILATAADARKLDFAGAVQYFINKIKDAPQGVMASPKTQDRVEPAKPEEKK